LGEKQARRDVLDREMQNPTFWNDQEKAKGVIAELKTLNAVLKPFEDVIKQAGDLTASIELAEEDGGDDFDDEIRAACTRAVADLEAFELRSMLGGPNDHCNVFVTIHAGAGGTEACDWAEMLMRMYMMWAESKRFAVQITDREDAAPRASPRRPSTSKAITPTATCAARPASIAWCGSARLTRRPVGTPRSHRWMYCPKSMKRSTS